MRGVADLAGARVQVAGARITGASVARLLAELGAEVTVTDSSPTQLQALAGIPELIGRDAWSPDWLRPRLVPTWW